MGAAGRLERHRSAGETGLTIDRQTKGGSFGTALRVSRVLRGVDDLLQIGGMASAIVDAMASIDLTTF
jgi:hypothetical protein